MKLSTPVIISTLAFSSVTLAAPTPSPLASPNPNADDFEFVRSPKPDQLSVGWGKPPARDSGRRSVSDSGLTRSGQVKEKRQVSATADSNGLVGGLLGGGGNGGLLGGLLGGGNGGLLGGLGIGGGSDGLVKGLTGVSVGGTLDGLPLVGSTLQGVSNGLLNPTLNSLGLGGLVGGLGLGLGDSGKPVVGPPSAQAGVQSLHTLDPKLLNVFSTLPPQLQQQLSFLPLDQLSGVLQNLQSTTARLTHLEPDLQKTLNSLPVAVQDQLKALPADQLKQTLKKIQEESQQATRQVAQQQQGKGQTLDLSTIQALVAAGVPIPPQILQQVQQAPQLAQRPLSTPHELLAPLHVGQTVSSTVNPLLAPIPVVGGTLTSTVSTVDSLVDSILDPILQGIPLGPKSFVAAKPKTQKPSESDDEDAGSVDYEDEPLEFRHAESTVSWVKVSSTQAPSPSATNHRLHHQSSTSVESATPAPSSASPTKIPKVFADLESVSESATPLPSSTMPARLSRKSRRSLNVAEVGKRMIKSPRPEERSLTFERSMLEKIEEAEEI